MKSLLLTVATVAILGGSCCATHAFPQQGKQTTPAQMWPQRLANLKDKNWRDAYAVGGAMAALPPEQGYKILSENWTALPDATAKQQIVKAFAFSYNGDHPFLLDILHLAATDTDTTVQSWAFTYLKQIAFQDFAEDYSAYLIWHDQWKGHPLEEVRLQNALHLLADAKKAQGAERVRLGKFVGRLQSLFPEGDSKQRAALIDAGALDVAASWLTDAKASREVWDGASTLIASCQPDEAWMKRVVLPLTEPGTPPDQRSYALRTLRGKEHQWAVPFLIDLMLRCAKADTKPGKRNAADVAEALGRLEDPRAIPAMIGLIASDDTYGTVYTVGWFGLNRLTGVNYEESHNGAWWKDWWAKNKMRFSEAVRAIPIPELPPTGNAPTGNEPKNKPVALRAAPAPPPTLDELLQQLREMTQSGKATESLKIAQKIAGKGEARAVPVLIGAIAADDSTDIVYNLGWFALSPLTGVDFDAQHDGAWWTVWWKKNKMRFPEAVRGMSIPDLRPKADPAKEAALGAHAAASPQVAALRTASFPVRSILPDDSDDSDLAPLAKAIGNARVVLLGEQSHGDGATFLAKRRLVRFLHERMGFNVLAWESGLYDCERMDRALDSPQIAAQDALNEGIFPIWGASGHVQPLFEYARETRKSPHPLRMTGFDCQFSSPESWEAYPVDLFAALDRSHSSALTPEQRRIIAAQCRAMGEEYHPTPEQRQAFRDALNAAQKALEAVSGPTKAAQAERDLYRRTIENLRTFEEIKAFDAARGDQKATVAEGTNTRDRAMGENLIWLARQRYPKEKIIVWAASFHLMRNAAAIDTHLDPADKDLDYKTTRPMGQVVHETLTRETYTLAFTAYRGAFGNPFSEVSRLEPAAPDTLEWALHYTGTPYRFVDLRSLPTASPLRGTLIARPLGYSPMRADWGSIFDGLFFTDTMFPSTSDGHLPTALQTAR